MSEVKVQFKVNNADVPINGPVNHKYNKEGHLVLSFQVGTTKLDNIEITFSKLTYVKEHDEEKSIDNN